MSTNASLYISGQEVRGAFDPHRRSFGFRTQDSWVFERRLCLPDTIDCLITDKERCPIYEASDYSLFYDVIGDTFEFVLPPIPDPWWKFPFEVMGGMSLVALLGFLVLFAVFGLPVVWYGGPQPFCIRYFQHLGMSSSEVEHSARVLGSTLLAHQQQLNEAVSQFMTWKASFD